MAIRINCDKIEISIPYGFWVIRHLNSIEGSQWRPDSRLWTCPATPQTADQIINEMEGFLDVSLGVRQLAKEKQGNPLRVIESDEERRTLCSLWDVDHLRILNIVGSRELANSPELLKILQDRGIGKEDCNRFSLGMILEKSPGTNMFIFPTFSEDHDVTSISLIPSPVLQNGDVRYYVSIFDGPTQMYIPDFNLIQSQPFVLVASGILDAVSLAKISFPAVSAPLGLSYFNPMWLNSYQKPIYIVPKRGDEKAAQLLAGHLGERARIIHVEYGRFICSCNSYLWNDQAQELVVIINREIASIGSNQSAQPVIS